MTKSALRCGGKGFSLWPISAVLVVAAPALRVTLQFISIFPAMVECRQEETNCSLDSIGKLSLLFACKTQQCGNAGE